MNNDAPQEFRDHCDYITELVDQIPDQHIRVQVLDAIETLVHNLNGPWQGATVVWQWGEVPDTLEGLFDVE